MKWSFGRRSLTGSVVGGRRRGLQDSLQFSMSRAEVSSSSYYEWKNKTTNVDTAAEKEKAKLIMDIAKIHKDSHFLWKPKDNC